MANKEVNDLPLIPNPNNGDVYIAKTGVDYRVRAGEANGIATLDSSGKLTPAQANFADPVFSGVVQIDNSLLVGGARVRIGTASGRAYFQAGDPSPDNTGGIMYLTGWLGTKADRIVADTTTLEVIGDIQARASGTGSAVLTPGSATLPGYVGFYTPDGTRRGFIGWGNGSNTVYQMENGWGFTIAGPSIFRVDSNTTFTQGPRIQSGTISTQTTMFVYGWNNNVQRAATVLETNASIGWYSYDAAGSFIANTLNIGTTGTCTAVNFVATSDRELKTDIKERKARERLPDMLRFVDFLWKATGKEAVGVIAQEIREIAPEYVEEFVSNGETRLAVDKAGLALECVIGLAARVRELEAK